MSNDNIVTHQWTAEEKAIIEREKALLKEKRKLFFVTSIFILAILKCSFCITSEIESPIF